MRNTLILLLMVLVSACGGGSSSDRNSGGLFSSNVKPEDIVGTWNIVMTCTKLDCEGYVAGNIMTENWNISYIDSSIRVIVTGNTTTASSYQGVLGGNTLSLQSKSSRNKTDVVLKIQSGKEMTGTREVINAGYEAPCSIDYSLEATR
jgi:hypothetical protein